MSVVQTLSPAAAVLAVASVLLICIAFQAWCLWQVRRSVRALMPLDERVSRLAHSIGLLTDTTEGCFDAISATLVRQDDVPTAGRQRRQRRVVTAAKRGHTVPQIAAQEAIAEGEVALRVQMARNLHKN